ncbi:hypothetical protein F2P79_021875 [Pimephales promelas]|nr:hypothetical protein F2P79_021875 [Pimephales promelas]
MAPAVQILVYSVLPTHSLPYGSPPLSPLTSSALPQVPPPYGCCSSASNLRIAASTSGGRSRLGLCVSLPHRFSGYVVFSTSITSSNPLGSVRTLHSMATPFCDAAVGCSPDCGLGLRLPFPAQGHPPLAVTTICTNLLHVSLRLFIVLQLSRIPSVWTPAGASIDHYNTKDYILSNGLQFQCP